MDLRSLMNFKYKEFEVNHIPRFLIIRLLKPAVN